MCSKDNRWFKSKRFQHDCMNKWINKTLTKHISHEFKCKCDVRICNLNQICNKDKCWCEYENLEEHHVYEKDYIWNTATCSCEKGKYAESINTDSVITCD